MRNFGEVVPGLLWRSGKYTASQLRHSVHLHKIEQVIDLRDRLPLLAISTYQHIGVKFINFPVDEYRGLHPNALDIWDGQTPTLVHCWKGAHRTGAWVARFRIEQCGWPEKQALKEMISFGFGSISLHQELFRSVFSESGTI